MSTTETTQLTTTLLVEILRDGLVSAETACEAADRIAELEAENAKLAAHIRAIAEQHNKALAFS